MDWQKIIPAFKKTVDKVVLFFEWLYFTVALGTYITFVTFYIHQSIFEKIFNYYFLHWFAAWLLICSTFVLRWLMKRERRQDNSPIVTN